MDTSGLRCRIEKLEAGDRLVHAVKTGQSAIICITRGDSTKIDQLNSGSHNLLHIAAFQGRNDIVEFLLDLGASVDFVNGHNETALHLAVNGGHEEIVKTLIKKGARVDHRDLSGNTVLHTAAAKGNENNFKFLLAHGADMNAINNLERSVLHVAFENNCEEIAKILFQLGAQSNLKFKDGRNTGWLHFAAKMGNIDIFKILLECDGVDINERNSDQETALHIAIEKGHEDIVMILIELGAQIDVIDQREDSMLHKAAEGGNKKILELLLNCGFNINAVNINKSTALHYAAESGSEDLVRLLIERGSKVNVKNSGGGTELHCAAFGGKATVVELLIDSGVDINATTDTLNFTALHFACLQTEGSEEIAKILLERGALVNISSPLYPGDMELHCAARSGNKNILKLLLDFGFCDINATNEGKETALHIATEKGLEDIVKLLIERGAQVSATDKYGNSILHKAAKCDNRDIFYLLLNCKCDVNARNSFGETPLFIATNAGNENIVKILIENGAEIDAESMEKSSMEKITPLKLACNKGFEKIAKLLLLAGADIEWKNKSNDNTILGDAFGKIHYSVGIIKLLLRHGAKADILVKEIELLFAADFEKDSFPQEYTYEYWLGQLSGRRELLELLLDYWVEFEATVKNCNMFEALLQAARKGHETAVQLLLDYGAVNGFECFEGEIFNSMIDLMLLYHPGGKLAEIFVRHVVKMQSQKRVPQKILEDMEKREKLKAFKIQCEKELENLKSNDLELPLCKLLTSNRHSLAGFARNEKAVQFLNSDECYEKFPIYSSVLKNQMRRGIWRQILLNKVQYFFEAIAETEENKCFLPKLPKLCVEEIFSYFSNKDFRNLIKVCDPHNDFDLDLCDVELSEN